MIDAVLEVADELDDALIEHPRSLLSWLLVSSQWLPLCEPQQEGHHF